MPDDLKVIEPDPAVPVDSVKKPKQDATTEMFEDADGGTDVSPDDELDKKAFWAGFAEKCEACGVNALELYKQAKEKKKIKKLHKALKRDKPVVSGQQKALIAKNKGEAPTYENRPKHPPFDTWTKNQWHEFVASTGHKISK